MLRSFVLRRLDGSFLRIRAVLTDTVTNCDWIDESWVDRLEDASRFDPRYRRDLLKEYKDTYAISVGVIQG